MKPISVPIDAPETGADGNCATHPVRKRRYAISFGLAKYVDSAIDPFCRIDSHQKNSFGNVEFPQ